MYMSLLSTIGWIVRVGVTVALLASISPLLILLVAVRGAARAELVLAAGGRAARRGAVRRRTAGSPSTCSPSAPARRRARRSASPASAPDLPGASAERSGSAGSRRWPAPAGSRRPRTRSPGRSSASATWRPWSTWPSASAAPVPAVLLILAAGARLSSYVGATMGEIGFLRGVWLDGSRRLVWLETYAAAQQAAADVAPPDRLDEGIRLEGVASPTRAADRPRAGRRHPAPPARHGRRRRRRERRRQVHPGQAAGQDVRADRRAIFID